VLYDRVAEIADDQGVSINQAILLLVASATGGFEFKDVGTPRKQGGAMSTWRKVTDRPDLKKRVSPVGITVTESQQEDGLWHTERLYSDGRRYQAIHRSRTAATRETQRMANR